MKPFVFQGIRRRASLRNARRQRPITRRIAGPNHHGRRSRRRRIEIVIADAGMATPATLASRGAVRQNEQARPRRPLGMVAVERLE